MGLPLSNSTPVNNVNWKHIDRPQTLSPNISANSVPIGRLAGYVSRYSPYAFGAYLLADSAVGIYNYFNKDTVKAVADDVPAHAGDFKEIPKFEEVAKSEKEKADSTQTNLIDAIQNLNSPDKFEMEMEMKRHGDFALVNAIDRQTALVNANSQLTNKILESSVAVNIELVEALTVIANGLGEGSVNVAYKDSQLSTTIDIVTALSNIDSKMTELISSTSSEAVAESIRRFKPVEVREVNTEIKFPDSHTVKINRTKEEIKLTKQKLEEMPDRINLTKQRREEMTDRVPLTKQKLKHINYELEPVQLDNIADDIPKATPQEMRAIKDAVVAKKNSDENTFDVDNSDIEDMFDMPDLSSIFNFIGKSGRYEDVTANHKVSE